MRSVRNAGDGEQVVILNGVIQAGLVEKGIFKEIPGVGEGAGHVLIWGKSFPG